MIAKSLNELFESASKVRILKLFLRNSEEEFSLVEVAKRSQVPKGQCRRYIQRFIGLGLIKTAGPTRNVQKTKKKKKGKKRPRR